MEFFKKLFCNHDWKIDREFIVHYPDYEPHKIGIIRHCNKCLKVDRKLYYPYDYIQEFGREEYEKVVKGRK